MFHSIAENGEANKVVVRRLKSVFEGVMFLGAFSVTVLSMMLPFRVRNAFARVLMTTVDTTLKNRVILRLAVDVRWKKYERR